MKCWSLLVRENVGPLMSLLSLIHEVLCLLWFGGGTVPIGCSDWLPGCGSLSFAYQSVDQCPCLCKFGR